MLDGFLQKAPDVCGLIRDGPQLQYAYGDLFPACHTCKCLCFCGIQFKTDCNVF